MGKFFKLAIRNYYVSYQGVPKPCWVYIIFNLLNAISVGVCFFLSLYFVDLLHFNMIMVGLLMSSYGIGTVLGGIVSGKLCDKFSSGLLSIISLILQSAAFLALACFHVFHSLAMILFILGVSNYSFKTANNVSMLSSCQDEKRLRQKVINISHAASNFGLGISGIIIGMMSVYGYAKIFYSASAILVFSSIYLLMYTNQKTSLLQACKEQNKQSVSDADTPNIKILTLTLLSLFFIGLIIAQLGSTYPIYVKDAYPELATKAVSILFILDTVLIVLFQAPLSNYCGRFNTMLTMGFGAFLMGLGMMVLSLASTFTWAMLSCCIWTTGEMLFLPTAQLLCYENGSKNKKGQSIGIFQSTYAISTVVGPCLGGFIYSKVGANAMWYLSMIIGMTCLISCTMLVRNLKKKEPQFCYQ